MLKPALALFLLLAGATGARADSRHDGCSGSDKDRDRGRASSWERGRSSARGCDSGWDQARDDRSRSWDRDRDRDWRRDDRERSALDRFDGDRCNRRVSGRALGRDLAAIRFVVRRFDGRTYRDYACGCQQGWRGGYYESGRHGDRAWVPGYYETERACRHHR